MADSDPDLHRFIVGELSWRDLDVPGLALARNPDGSFLVQEGPGTSATPTIEDVALGIVRLWSRRDDLRDWAIVMLACSISFTEAERHRDWERLLEFIWDLSDGRCPEEAYLLAQQIVSESL